MPLRQEMAQRKRIAIRIPTRKALVCHIKERKVSPGLHHITDLTPLGLCRVNARRIMRTGMQQEHAVLRRSSHIGKHALEIEPDGVLVVVAVLLDLEARVLEDGAVVGPAWGGDEDLFLFAVWVEALEEGGAYPQGAGAGDGLGDGDTVFFDGGAGSAKCERGGGLGEGGDTGDAGVFLVEVRFDHLLLRSADGGEDVWLSLVITYIARGERRVKL